MTPEEQDNLLARIDTKLDYIQEKCKSFCEFKDSASIDIAVIQNEKIPERVAALERWTTYRDGALAVLLVLVGGGKLYDFINFLNR